MRHCLPPELVGAAWARHGDGWEGMRAGVGGEQGWPFCLGRFAAAVGNVGDVEVIK